MACPHYVEFQAHVSIIDPHWSKFIFNVLWNVMHQIFHKHVLLMAYVQHMEMDIRYSYKGRD